MEDRERIYRVEGGICDELVFLKKYKLDRRREEMKRLIGFIFLFGILLFSGYKKVAALSFTEGDFINGEYITKVNGSKKKYLTLQFINDEKGHFIYCLEPFALFKEGKEYQEYENLTAYSSLSEEQKREISLIAYYGYGYKNRTDSKWYAITQYMIWKIVDSEANIYFTDTLNGKKISKYTSEINEINSDIQKHESKETFIKDYVINYGITFKIYGYDATYDIKGDYDVIVDDNGFSIDKVVKNGKLFFTKVSNYYNDSVRIYDSADSQDLIRPGNVVNQTYEINIKVRVGDVVLNINDDDSVYSVEKDFTNTCYQILKESQVVDTVCTGKDSLVYNSDKLPYGNYTVKQISYGVGYRPNTNTYSFSINENNEHPVLSINNYLIKNDIEITKYACKDNKCAFEENAIFEVRDKNGDLVDKMITDGTGYAKKTFGYGTYQVIQVEGLDGYTMVDSYKEFIKDQKAKHKSDLFNYYIPPIEEPPVEIPVEEPKEETPVEDPKEEIPIEQPSENEEIYDGELPPETGIFSSLIKTIKKVIGSCRVYLRIIL